MVDREDGHGGGVIKVSDAGGVIKGSDESRRQEVSQMKRKERGKERKGRCDQGAYERGWRRS